MKKILLLITASTVAFYAGQTFASGKPCPNNKGRHAKTAKPVQKNRAIAALNAPIKSNSKQGSKIR